MFERERRIGGVWAAAYPDVHLQNIASHYHLADFPWPFEPDLHPSGEQIMRYLEAAIVHFDLDVRLGHEVTSMREAAGMREAASGWQLEVSGPDGPVSHAFDYVVVAVGQYTQPKAALALADVDRFEGEIVTERDIHDLDVLAGKRVTVVGFGKSAVDLASFAAARGSRVTHVFRTPRWLIPQYLLGLVHFAKILFARFGSVMVTCWTQPTAFERALHGRGAPLIRGFWAMLTAAVRLQIRAYGLGKGPAAAARLRTLSPAHSMLSDMRSAAALAPADYFPAVARGEIEPVRGVVRRCCETGVVLEDGSEIDSELIVLCLGSGTPVFPFMPPAYRELLERESDGVQLYRHLIHPQIPNVAFAGYNHGFMHVPASEVGALWIGALLRGDLELPPVAEMDAAIEHVRAWKREHINYEPSRSCAITTRFHQYLDVLLTELGLSAKRKRNGVAEWFQAYGAADYAGLLDEYEAARARQPQSWPRRPSALMT